MAFRRGLPKVAMSRFTLASLPLLALVCSLPTAALAYYPNIPKILVNPALARVAYAPVTGPVRMIYGTEDGAIGPEMFLKQEKRFRGGFDLCEATGRGHFMQYEDPAWFADRVVEYFRIP